MSARELVVFGQPALYAVVDDLMRQMDVGPSDLRQVPPDAALVDLVQDPDAYVCSVWGPDYPDGDYIPREHWHYAPAPGHVVLFHRPMLGGGGGKGSARMMLMALAAIAISVITVGAGTGLAATLLKVGLTLAANALINKLVPLDNSNAPRGAESPTYSVNAQGNQARIDGVVPELFGRNNAYPDFACPPYSLFIGDDQYVHVVLMVGRGQHLIRKVANETTALEAYSDVQIIRAGPGQSTLDGPGSGVETLADQDLVELNIVTSPVVSNQELETERFSGPYPACPPERQVVSIGVDTILPRGLDAGREIVWAVQAQLIDDFDQPLGAWTTLGTHTYNTASPTPVRISNAYTVAAGRYQVGFRRLDTRSTDSGSSHDITVTALRGTLDEPGIDYDEGTFVVIKARATGQLNGALRIRVMSDRMLPVWDGSAWTAPQVTRNPAWAIARVLTTRGLSDDQIDLDQLLALAETWDARFDKFDYAFDTVSTMWDALAMIARVGRAVPLIRGSRYTFWRDQQESSVVGGFTMRNIRRDTFRLVFAFPEDDPVNAIEVEYFDHRRGDWVTITAQWDAANQRVRTWRSQAERVLLGLDAPDRPARVKIPGIIGENHCRRFAAFNLADIIFRPHRARFNSELVGLLPAYGSLCSLQHDVGNFGQGGDVVDWDADTLTLSTSEPLEWTPGATHYMRLYKPTGEATGAILATQGDNDYSVVLGSAPGFTPVTTDPDRVRTPYAFGPADNVEALVKPRVIKPRNERDIEIEVVLEDDRVHTADLDWLTDDPISEGTPPDTSGGYTVFLTTRTISKTVNEAEGVVPAVGFELRDDGGLRLYVRTYGAFGGPLLSEAVLDISNEWMQPNPVTTTISGLYESRFTLLGVDLMPGAYDLAGTFDVWQVQSTGRAVEFKSAAGASQMAQIRVELQDAATDTLQIMRTIYLHTGVTPSGGGGE